MNVYKFKHYTLLKEPSLEEYWLDVHPGGTKFVKIFSIHFSLVEVHKGLMLLGAEPTYLDEADVAKTISLDVRPSLLQLVFTNVHTNNFTAWKSFANSDGRPTNTTSEVLQKNNSMREVVVEAMLL